MLKNKYLTKVCLTVLTLVLGIEIFYLIYNVDKWQRKANQSKPISLQKS